MKTTMSVPDIEKEKEEGNFFEFPLYVRSIAYDYLLENTQHHHTTLPSDIHSFTHSLIHSRTTSPCSLPCTTKELVTKR